MNKEFSKAKSTGKHFWIRGYFVITVGLNEKAVRDYIKHQELTEKRQLNLPEFDEINAPSRGSHKVTGSAGRYLLPLYRGTFKLDRKLLLMEVIDTYS